MPALSFDGVSHRYVPAGRPALADVELSVDEGELVLLVGESGSGKSTLLRAALGLVPHFHGGELRGSVCVAGLDTRRHRPGELARHAGLVFQDPEAQVVMQHVLAEAAFGLENLGVAPGEIHPRALAALDMVGAAHLAERTTRTLSGGERQRVAIASVLAMGPRVLLLDEPTSQLDPAAADELIRTLIDLRDRHGIAIVVAEHRTERMFDVADRIVAMRAGAIEVDAPPPLARAALAGTPWLLPRAPAERPPDADPADPAARLEHACKRLGSTPALVDVSAAFGRGVVTAVTGANGAGKTTLALAALRAHGPRQRHRSSEPGGPDTSRRTRPATCSTTRRSRRSSTASRTWVCRPSAAATARWPSWSASSSSGPRPSIRVTCRAASGSGLRSPPSPRCAPTSSCSTSRRGASTGATSAT